MRRGWGVAAFVAFGVVLTVAFGPGQLRAEAQGGTPPAAGQGFVGSWRLTIPGPPLTQSLITFLADGSVIDTDLPVAAAGPGRVVFTSIGHGVWQQTGATTARFTVVDLVADAHGNLVAIETINGDLTLGADGASIRVRFTVTATDPGGKVLSQVGGTVQGTRITLQPMSTPAAGTPAA